ncbi:hypothetical protein [Stenotrophomonas sp. NA06056]|uniref:hypothetical protein n=1 Tax=Stenotrophomonas sp. NA06056 TaxID=2742129 RepID=UPI00158CF7CD|nr:hypothetical protein [Stenotrophomonas sp. NA06056]QKW56798.1 hypothetical protein HUT07_09280 [Stenotrophomonas sp. NA06056]
MQKSIDQVSTTVISAITVFAFSAGAICAGWAVGKFSTTGNAADWIAAVGGAAAAVGTWAIGIGANSYAREAQLYRLSQEAKAERERCEARVRKLDYMISKAKLAGRQERAFKLLHGDDEKLTDLSTTIRKGKIRALEAALAKIVWAPEDVASLNAADQGALGNAEITMLQVRHFIEVCRDSGYENDVFLESIASSLATLSEEVIVLESRLLAERGRVLAVP